MIIKKYFKNFGGRKDQHTQGFTLVETLVALMILLTAVVSVISLIGDSLHKMYYARDEVLAVNLAQEGIEMVRQVRDTNMLGGSAWLTNLADGTYIIDVAGLLSGSAANGYVIPCAGCTQIVYLDGVKGLYRQGTGAMYPATQFSRLVTISSIGLTAAELNYERKVTSVVTWKTGGSTGTATASEYLFEWTAL